MPRIPPNVIDQIRDVSDIIDVISREVELKKRGSNYFGICPFHDEKTASFSVAPAKQIYHCFGCGSGGNVFSFLMEYHKISFPESIKMLADWYKIPIKIDTEANVSEIYTVLYQMNEKALNIFLNNLFHEKGKPALNYLRNRGINEDTIKKFRLGFSFDSWNQIFNAVKTAGFNNDQIEKSGLFTRSNKGIFDRFRSRIMIPIFHQSGKIIGFGGRIIGKDDPAKYLNSPETILYKKSNTLYGIHTSKDHIRKEGYAVLVEGYMDYLQLYQAGIKPVLATSGTAFTSSHARLLTGMTNKIIILFDGDEAGAKAAIRSGWEILKNGLEPLIIRPPIDLDPDDWIQNSGIYEIREHLNKPISFINFHLDYFKSQSLEGTERKQYILGIAKEIKAISDIIIRNDLIRLLSEKLKIEEKDLIQLIKNTPINRNFSGAINSDEQAHNFSFNSIQEKAQIEILQLMASNDTKIRNFGIKASMDIDFKHPLLKKLANHIKNSNSNITTAEIIEYFSEKNERDLVSKILFESQQNIDPEQIVKDCLFTLKSIPIKEKIRSLRAEIRVKESKGHDSEHELNEVIKLQNELNEI